MNFVKVVDTTGKIRWINLNHVVLFAEYDKVVVMELSTDRDGYENDIELSTEEFAKIEKLLK